MTIPTPDDTALENRLRALHDAAATLEAAEVHDAVLDMGIDYVARPLVPLPVTTTAAVGDGSAAPPPAAPSEADAVTLLWRVCGAGNVGATSVLLDAGAPPGGGQGPRGSSPLYVAAQNGHYAVCRVLLDAGAAPDEVPPGSTGATPLFIATQHGHYSIANALLQRGADVSRTNAQGCTPFVLACSLGHTEVALLLLRNGSRAHESAGGRRALVWARSNGHIATRVAVMLFMADALLTDTAFRLWRRRVQEANTAFVENDQSSPPPPPPPEEEQEDPAASGDGESDQVEQAPPPVPEPWRPTLPQSLFAPPLAIPSLRPTVSLRSLPVGPMASTMHSPPPALPPGGVSALRHHRSSHHPLGAADVHEEVEEAALRSLAQKQDSTRQGVAVRSPPPTQTPPSRSRLAIDATEHLVDGTLRAAVYHDLMSRRHVMGGSPASMTRPLVASSSTPPPPPPPRPTDASAAAAVAVPSATPERQLIFKQHDAATPAQQHALPRQLERERTGSNAEGAPMPKLSKLVARHSGPIDYGTDESARLRRIAGAAWERELQHSTDRALRGGNAPTLRR